MINERLKYLRKESKLTQGEIAEKIDVALTTYANWEQGTRRPDFETLKKLADIFGCTTDYLLGKENVMDKIPVKFKRAIEGLDQLRFDLLTDEALKLKLHDSPYYYFYLAKDEFDDVESAKTVEEKMKRLKSFGLLSKLNTEPFKVPPPDLFLLILNREVVNEFLTKK